MHGENRVPIHRKLLDLLSSTRLAIFLCTLLASVAVVGSLLYRGDTSLAEDPGLRVFSSPFFTIPALLLVINIIFCVSARVARSGGKAVTLLVMAHIFLIITIGGLLVDGKWSEVYTGYFFLRNPSGLVRDWKRGVDIELPYKIEVSGYHIQRYPYLLKIEARDSPEGKVRGPYTVREGETFDLPGTGVSMKIISFNPDEKEMTFEAFSGDRSLGVLGAGVDGSSPLYDRYVIVPVAFKDMGVKDMRAELTLHDGDGVHSFRVSPNNPAVYKGVNIALVESRYDRYMNLMVGFQFTRNPGEYIFWAGFLGFFLLMTSHLIIKNWRKRPQVT